MSNSWVVASVKLVYIYKVPRIILGTFQLVVMEIITDTYICSEENEYKKRPGWL